MAVGAISHENWTAGPQEPFSSQGPTNDGRIKPEISGPDNVRSSIFGSFGGTSASSPHVAGAAALILSQYPTYSVSQLWNALTSSAVDMGSSGQDNIYGYGRLNLPPVPNSNPSAAMPWIPLLLLDD
jgi:subtilisin family serine protease